VCSAWVLVLVGTHAVKALAEAGGAPKQGWVFAGVGAGIAVTGLACLAFMASGVGSAVAWLIIGAVALAASAVVAAGMGGLFPASRPPARRHGSERAPLDWRVVIAYGVMGLGYIIPATYLPVMAKAAVADPLVFGWSWPVFGAAAFVSTIVGGRLHARYTNRQIWAAGQAVMAAGVLLPVLAPHFVSVIVAGLAVGGTFMIVTMAGMKEAHRIAPEADVTRHIAVLTAAFATGQVIGPLGASLAYDLTGGFGAALAVTSVLLIATAVPLVAGSRRTVITNPR
jgi:predicted MFS family arabinose efflux permease